MKYAHFTTSSHAPDDAEVDGSQPRDDSPRRDRALAAIEDLLIRDGFIDVAVEEQRAFPAVPRLDRAGTTRP